MSRITIFDRFGTPLTEIEALTTRSWVLGGEGEASFVMATSDPKCKEAYLRYGNFLLIEHEELPNWCGVIEPERKWGYGKVEIRAFTLERLLKNCGTPLQKMTGSAGTIFEQILQICNRQLDLPFSFGEIYRGGPQREESLGDQAFEHVRRVRERSGHFWELKGWREGGFLKLWAEWKETIGSDSPIALIEGTNLALGDEILAEYGPIWNDVIGLGDAMTEGTRLSARREDAESIRRYGRRSTAIVFSGNRTLPTLEQNTEEYLRTHAHPAMRISAAEVVHEGEIFRWLRVGNRFRVILQSVGFSGSGFGYEANARLIGMEYSDERDSVRVELEI